MTSSTHGSFGTESYEPVSPSTGAEKPGSGKLPPASPRTLDDAAKTNDVLGQTAIGASAATGSGGSPHVVPVHPPKSPETTEDLVAIEGGIARISNAAVDGAQDIKNHTSHKWRCVSRFDDPDGSGGNIYNFTMKDHFAQTNVELLLKRDNEANLAIYPAVESHGIKFISNGFSGTGNPEVEQYFRFLGFSIKNYGANFYLELPDVQTLKARWQQLKDDGVVNHDLKIISSEGIATHRDFIKAYCEYDGLVSDGPEFVHDMQAHIIPLMWRIISCEVDGLSYERDVRGKGAVVLNAALEKLDELTKIKGLVAEGKIEASPNIDKLIKHWDILETSLGLFIDSLAASKNYTDYSKFIEYPKGRMLKHMLGEYPREAFVRLFPPDKLDALPEGSLIKTDLAAGIEELWNILESESENISCAARE